MILLLNRKVPPACMQCNHHADFSYCRAAAVLVGIIGPNVSDHVCVKGCLLRAEIMTFRTRRHDQERWLKVNCLHRIESDMARKLRQRYRVSKSQNAV